MEDHLMPLGIYEARVDDKGRLKLPPAFLPAMSVEKQWFLSRDGEGEMLYLRTTGEKNQGVETDSSGRIFIPSEFSASCKGKPMHLYWQEDQLVVMTSEEYETLKQAATNGPFPTTGWERRTLKIAAREDCAKRSPFDQTVDPCIRHLAPAASFR